MSSESSHAVGLRPQIATRFHEPTAQVSLRGARAAYVGPALDLAPHRNAVAVLAVALAAPFDLALFTRGTARPTFQPHAAALIPAGAHHHLKAKGPMVFLYLDALSDDHACIQKADLDAASGALRSAQHGPQTVTELCALLALPQRPPPDPRISGLFAAVDADPFARFAHLVRQAGLSQSRCRELIRQAVGIPFRRYRLWRRMAHVARTLAAGGSLTEAAHAAGFASSAHLSAAFKTMFGLAPSALLKAGVAFDVD